MSRAHGFTFVEVLISLAISALLVGTICSALIHITQMERQTVVLREAPFLLQTLACRSYLHQEQPQETAARIPRHWSATMNEELVKDEAEETPWVIWRLAPAKDPSFSYRLALRDGLGPW